VKADIAASGSGAGRGTEPLRPEQSLGELLSEMATEMGQLVRQEVALAKAEAKEEASKLSKGAGMLGAAGAATWFVLLFLSVAAAHALDEIMNSAIAYLVVAAVWLVAAIVLAVRGRQQVRRARAMPITVETIKEDMQWRPTRTS
jgi:uncharacterized membrane protein YqjE